MNKPLRSFSAPAEVPAVEEADVPAGNPRRYSFKLYPTGEQAERLLAQCRVCVDLWNALLNQRELAAEGIYRPLAECFAAPPKIEGETREQRRDRVENEHRARRERQKAAREAGTAIKVSDRGKKGQEGLISQQWEIGQLFAAKPEWRELSTWTPRRVSFALDKAFKAFFQRAKAGAGASSGYPRYRRRAEAAWLPHRFASGCGLTAVPDKKADWWLTLKGVDGPIFAKGKFPRGPLKWSDADIRYHAGTWWLSVGVDVPSQRLMQSVRMPVRVQIDAVSLSAVVGAKICFAPAMPDIEDDLGTLQKAMAEVPRDSDEYAELRRRKARVEARASRQRREALHEWTTAIVAQASEIVASRPKSVREVTKSGRGDATSWGASTDVKAEFNRAVLDMAPAMVCQMLKYKAAEAGIPYSEEFHDGLGIGNAVVEAAKEVRRTRRVIKREKEITNV